MEEKETAIVVQVHKMFLKYGIKSVTMDDIARELGISKKTLYQFVKDKNDLVNKAMDYQVAVDIQKVADITAKKLNAVDELLEIGQFVSHTLKSMGASALYDIQKYYPEVWRSHFEYRQNYVANTIAANIAKGIKEGYYRKNMNAEVIAKFFVVKVENMFDDRIFPPDQYNLADVYLEYIRYHLMGIASQKGADYIIEKICKKPLK